MWLSIGGLAIEIGAWDRTTSELVRAHWPEFVRTSPIDAPDVVLTVTADPSMKDAWSATMPSELSVRKEGGDGGDGTDGTDKTDGTQEDGSAWRFERADFSGVWSPKARRAEVRYAGDLPFLSSFLRVLSCAILSRKGGVLIHASCVRTAGGAVLFPGPSGTGKSTIAGLAPEGTVLSDEVTAVQFVNGRLAAFPTPFWGDLRRTRAAEAAPLRAIVAIDRNPNDLAAPSSSCVPASPSLTLALIAHCTFAFEGGAVDKEGLLSIVKKIVRSSPLFLLRYAPPENPWPLLERTLPSVEADVEFVR